MRAYSEMPGSTFDFIKLLAKIFLENSENSFNEKIEVKEKDQIKP